MRSLQDLVSNELAIDGAIAWALYWSTGPAGVVMALLYTLFADGILQGQSPGKKIFGVKVVYLPTRSGARHRDSVLRNAPFGLVVILSMMLSLVLSAVFYTSLWFSFADSFGVDSAADGADTPLTIGR